jgi:hypothetical protein
MLKIPTPYATGLLATLWDWASDFCPDGGIGRLSNEEIAEAMGWRGAANRTFADESQRLITALVEAHWLDTDESQRPSEGSQRLIIHDWPDHCENTIHRKLARAGVRFADGSVPKLTGLNEKERKQAEELFAERAHDVLPSVLTACALPLPLPLPLPGPIPRPEPEPEPLRSADIPGFLEVSEPTTVDQNFENLWLLFVASGKPLNDEDKRRAATKWVMIPVHDQDRVIRWAVEQFKSAWRDAAHTPYPANALESRGWTRVAGRRIIPAPDPVSDEAAQILAEKLARRTHA